MLEELYFYKLVGIHNFHLPSNSMVQSKRKMAAPMKLVYEPTSNDSISWSEDNQIAIATEKCVNIFVSHV